MIPRIRAARRWLRPALGALAMLALAGGWAFGQEKRVDPVPGERSPVYQSQGKRDPFISLRSLRQERPESELPEPPPLAKRPPGLPGLLIDEVAVVGIVAGVDEPIALLRGVDDFTYFARSRDKLYDGHVAGVQGEKVTFTRRVEDSRGNMHQSTIIKRLNSQEIQVVDEKGGTQDEEL